MKLSEAIAMVEEWLDEHTYNYMIYQMHTDGLKWVIKFYEYSPCGKIECDTYFLVPCNGERRIYNSNVDDVLDLGRYAYDNDADMMKWFDEFERRWDYGNETTN